MALILGSAGTSALAADPLIFDASLHVAGMTRFWQAALPVATGDAVKEGFLVDDTLYVTTVGGTIFSVEAASGLIRWGDKIGQPGYVIYRPAHSGGAAARPQVVIPTSTGVWVRDRFSGDVVTRFTPGFNVTSPGLVLGDVVYIGALDGRFRALRYFPGGELPPVPLWTAQTGGEIRAGPVMGGTNILLFASTDGVVYCLDPADKALFWRYRTDGAVRAEPVVVGTAVFVAGTDRQLYRLDLRSGRPVWRLRFPERLTSAPVVLDGTVYQRIDGRGVRAVDADDGKERWSLPEASWFAAGSGDAVYFLAGGNRLLVVDRGTGQVEQTIALPAGSATVANMADEAIYALGRDGRILCARPDRTPYLRRQQIIAAEARLNAPPAEGTSATTNVAREQPPPDPRAEDPLRSRHDNPP